MYWDWGTRGVDRKAERRLDVHGARFGEQGKAGLTEPVFCELTPDQPSLKSFSWDAQIALLGWMKS